MNTGWGGGRQDVEIPTEWFFPFLPHRPRLVLLLRRPGTIYFLPLTTSVPSVFIHYTYLHRRPLLMVTVSHSLAFRDQS